MSWIDSIFHGHFGLWGRARSRTVPDPVNKVDEDVSWYFYLVFMRVVANSRHLVKDESEWLQLDMHCTYNATSKRVGVTTAVVEKQKLLQILSVFCSLKYPTWNAHAPYCHVRPVRFYSIFPHYLMIGTIFKKKLLNVCFDFLYQFYVKHFPFSEGMSEMW